MGRPLDEYTSVMKSAGDPVRARILKLLEGDELCVSDLVAILKLSQSSVSGHLSTLNDAGMIAARREGKWSFFTLANRANNRFAPPMLALLMGWLDDDPLVRADKRRQKSLAPGRG